jgi:flavin-dependent thymidylate synthase
MGNNMSQIKVELQDSMGGDRSISEAAWTSSLDYQKKQTRTEDDVKRVVNMLADMKHSTPFESVVLRFWISMPIQTDRQHMTHRIGSHSGMSGRYRTMPSEFLEVPSDIMDIQAKIDAATIAPHHSDTRANEYLDLCKAANDWYNDTIQHYRAIEKAGHITNDEFKRLREFYRGVLPQNNMTERVTIFNLRSFSNYQKLRNSPHAQPEIRQVAQLMLEAVKAANICPIAIEALERNGWSI